MTLVPAFAEGQLLGGLKVSLLGVSELAIAVTCGEALPAAEIEQ